MHSAPEHAGPTREDTDVSVDSNLTLMWKVRGNPERSDTYVSDLVDARPAWEHPDFDWGAICIWDCFDAVGYTEYAEIVMPFFF